MQILMTSVSFFGRGAPIRLDPLTWVICAIVTYSLNYVLTGKSATVPVYAGANAAVFAVSVFAFIQTAHALTGFMGYLLTVVFAIVTIMDAIRCSTKTYTVYSRIIRFDAYIMLMIWYFLSVSGGLPMYDAPLVLSVLALNIICNLALRSSEENAGKALTASPIAGTLFSVGLFGLMSAIVYGFVRLFASGSRSAVETIIYAVQTGLRVFFSLLGRFFEWLFSFFPDYESDEGFMVESPGIASGEETFEQIHVPDAILYVIAAVCAAALIAGVIYFVFRFRKKRVTFRGFGNTSPWGHVRSAKGTGRLKRRLKAIIDSFVFNLKSIRYLNTPQGTFVRLERWGSKRSRAKKQGETMREYLLALSPDLVPIADDLDLIYFGAGTGCLSKADCRRIRHDFMKANRSKH